ncbi:hypothetical protein, partial [Paraburkholderia terricola]|uniref:hypothetical protein n=1 Tax=Paraburkholderia terricola TaxID=169427 RepID=UPI00286C5A52
CPLFFSHLARAMTITRARLPGFVAEMWVITRLVPRLLNRHDEADFSNDVGQSQELRPTVAKLWRQSQLLWRPTPDTVKGN